MKLLITLVLALVGTGCATTSQTYLPNGKVGHVVKCPGMANDWGSCFSKAGEVCGAKGYDIVNQSGQVIPAAVFNQTGTQTNTQATAFSGAMVSRTLMVQCKD